MINFKQGDEVVFRLKGVYDWKFGVVSNAYTKEKGKGQELFINTICSGEDLINKNIVLDKPRIKIGETVRYFDPGLRNRERFGEIKKIKGNELTLFTIEKSTFQFINNKDSEIKYWKDLIKNDLIV